MTKEYDNSMLSTRQRPTCVRRRDGNGRSVATARQQRTKAPSMPRERQRQRSLSGHCKTNDTDPPSAR
jgi:hypothetical protein